jgi:hypothetical protein
VVQPVRIEIHRSDRKLLVERIRQCNARLLQAQKDYRRHCLVHVITAIKAGWDQQLFPASVALQELILHEMEELEILEQALDEFDKLLPSEANINSTWLGGDPL